MSRNSSKQAQAKGGFTLVELVVVIAVLAILAGVGAVAYNGYIEYAKKGVDRKTVGEIMHAVELADYSDSSLIPEGGSATVYLTSSGANAFDGEKTTEFKASVADALGDLSTVKLSYEKWNEEEGSFDPTAVRALLEGMKDKWEDTTSSIYKYLQGDGSASFAGNIEEYWGAVQDYVELFSSAYGEGGTDPDKDYLLSAVVNESIDPDTASKYVTYFGAGGADEGLNHGSKSFRAAAVASNYAFAAWLSANHSADITEDMMENYKSLTTVGRNVLSFGSWANNADWKPLIEEYYNTQGETDMLAYLGMLEAAKTMEPAGEHLKDVDFVPQAGKVVNVAAGVLNRSVSKGDLEALVKSLTENGSGSIIAVKATKTNGQLIFDVDPDSADPRETSSKVVESCELEHINHVYVSLYKVGGSSGISILNAGTSKANESDVSNPLGNNPVVICSKDSSFKSCTFELLQGVTDGSITVTDGDDSCISISGLTITAVKAGTCKITLSTNTDSGAKTKNFTINVH